MKKFTIYLAGDSTVQSYKTPVKPITGAKPEGEIFT